MEKNKTKEKIISLLKSKGITIHGGIQLFSDQHDTDWSISVNYSSTGIHIPKDDICVEDLEGDEEIKVCRTWTWHE